MGNTTRGLAMGGADLDTVAEPELKAVAAASTLRTIMSHLENAEDALSALGSS